MVIHGIVGDGLEFRYIQLAVLSQNGFVRAHIDDLAHQPAGVGIVGDQPAFQCHGQLVNERCVHKQGFGGVKTSLGELVRFFVAADDAHIVTGCRVFGSCHGYGEGFPCQEILGGLVVGIYADGDLLFLADAAPGGIHGVGGAVGIVSADDVHGHGITHRLGAEILSHSFLPFSSVFLSIV